MPRGMRASYEVNQEARADEFVVDVVAATVFMFGVGQAQPERVVNFETSLAGCRMARPHQHRSCKRAIGAYDVSQLRVVVHFFGHSPAVFLASVHRNIVAVQPDAEAERGIVVVVSKRIVVGRLRRVIEFYGEGRRLPVFLVFLLIFFHHDEPSGADAGPYAPVAHRVAFLGRNESNKMTK